jgi:hypothetical protein
MSAITTTIGGTFMALTLDQRHSRLRYDWTIAQRMFGSVFSGEAYTSTEELEQRTSPITMIGEAHRALAYRVDFFVPTLIGPGEFAPVTTIGFGLETGDYPYSEPLTWIISDHVPYSPHFTRAKPACLGELWPRAHGKMLLGQLFVHVAKLLNWDEIGRDSGYVGYNPAAIAYHRAHYGDRPLDPHLQYPTLPTDLTHGTRFAALPPSVRRFAALSPAPSAPNRFTRGASS